MVKSGDKQIEEEVIQSSRALYCRPREVVEREINDWSGMSLGNDTDTGSATLERFPVICSFCGKEKTVPFKPEPGRPVYCKECIVKIKSGEVKVEKSSENQIKYDESKFFKPLADLGIEFEQKSKGKNEEINRYPERIEAHGAQPHRILSNIKKAFTKEDKFKPVRPGVGNPALREVLNKITADGATPQNAVVNEPATAVDGVPPKAAISLDSLKEKIKESRPSGPARSAGGDRAASAEEMNKLKDLIKERTEITTSFEPEGSQSPNGPAKATPPPQGGEEAPAPIPKKPKEVPEDVLRKILE